MPVALYLRRRLTAKAKTEEPQFFFSVRETGRCPGPAYCRSFGGVKVLRQVLTLGGMFALCISPGGMDGQVSTDCMWVAGSISLGSCIKQRQTPAWKRPSHTDELGCIKHCPCERKSRSPVASLGTIQAALLYQALLYTVLLRPMMAKKRGPRSLKRSSSGWTDLTGIMVDCRMSWTPRPGR